MAIPVDIPFRDVSRTATPIVAYSCKIRTNGHDTVDELRYLTYTSGLGKYVMGLESKSPQALIFILIRISCFQQITHVCIDCIVDCSRICVLLYMSGSMCFISFFGWLLRGEATRHEFPSSAFSDVAA